VSSIRIEHPDGKNGLFQAMIGSSLDDVGLLTGRLLTARTDGGDSSFTPRADQLQIQIMNPESTQIIGNYT
jgi:hypothetical protein